MVPGDAQVPLLDVDTEMSLLVSIGMLHTVALAQAKVVKAINRVIIMGVRATGYGQHRYGTMAIIILSIH